MRYDATVRIGVALNVKRLKTKEASRGESEKHFAKEAHFVSVRCSYLSIIPN